MKLPESFFARDSRDVAADLIGRELVRYLDNTAYRGTITETAAYSGKGSRTAGNGIAYAPGKIYIMGYRGRNFLNIATDAEGIDSCVQIRRIRLDGEDLGPMQLTKRLQIHRNLDGDSIEGYHLWIEDDKSSASSFTLPEQEKMAPNCLGIYRAI